MGVRAGLESIINHTMEPFEGTLQGGNPYLFSNIAAVEGGKEIHHDKLKRGSLHGHNVMAPCIMLIVLLQQLHILHSRM